MKPGEKPSSDCPSAEQLEAFVLGKAAEAPRIGKHVEGCVACQALIKTLAAATLSVPVDQYATIPNLHRGQAMPAASPYAFLAPPVNGDEVGRLANYRVLRLLGQGGMGMVFLAEDLSLRRQVALKVMRPDLQGDHDVGRRFLREAQAMAALKHEHLVTVFQAGEETGLAFLAMELLEGESLDSWMTRVPTPDVAEILRLGQEITAGLAFIHRKNLIHRDIKPANIWLEAPNRHVKILDLGLVLPIADAKLTLAGMVLGTPEFMSPEQARGDPVDARSDLFSLGGVLYYLCTARKPFQGSSSTAVLMSLASETPPPASQLNPKIPRALSDLVAQLLLRNVKKRPASAEAVLERLRQIEKSLNQQPDRTEALHPIQRRKDALPETETYLKEERSGNQRGFMLLAGGMGVFAVLTVLAGWLIGTFGLSNRPPEKGLGKGPEKELEKLAGNKVFLADLREIARENWPFKKGPAPPGKEPKKKDGKDGKEFDMSVRFQGAPSPHGIFMHPPVPPHEHEPASLTYRLGQQFQAFQSQVSLNDGQVSEAPCTFWVYGDGKLLWKSAAVSSDQDTQKCVVAVKNVEELKIAVTCSGEPRGAHAIWVEPFLVKK